MSKYDERLKDYVDVKERIRLFYVAHPDGRLVTTNVQVRRDPDDVPRVWVEACAYRTPDDPLPGRGWSWLVLPGTTPYTRGSELENAETSAWGRAIGALGIGIAGGIASRDEIAAKVTEPAVARGALVESDGDGLIGTVEVGKPEARTDFELREEPDGLVLGFRLRGERGGIKVLARRQLAVDLRESRDKVVGTRVTCWGALQTERFTTRAGRDISYQVLDLARIRGPFGELPGELSSEREAGLIAEDEAAIAERMDELEAAAGLFPEA